MNKKVVYIIVGLLSVVILAACIFVFSKSKSKELLLTIDKVFYAYSSFIIDMGYSPRNIKELYINQSNLAKWKGPYISKSTLDNYSKGDIKITQATNIPTKPCSLDYLSNCYSWIKVTNFSKSDFDELKAISNKNIDSFFANQNVYFKVSIVE